MAKMFHGVLFYASHGRSVGTFGGRAKTATVKIYRSNDAGSPACTIEQPAEFLARMAECGEDRTARDRVMAEFVSNANR